MKCTFQFYHKFDVTDSFSPFTKHDTKNTPIEICCELVSRRQTHNLLFKQTQEQVYIHLCFSLQDKQFPLDLSVFFSFFCIYMYTCHYRLYTLQLWISLRFESNLDCLPLAWQRLLRKSYKRGSSKPEKKLTSIHTSCCTPEPKLPMTHPENSLSSQYDTSPPISRGWQLIRNKYKRGQSVKEERIESVYKNSQGHFLLKISNTIFLPRISL